MSFLIVGLVIALIVVGVVGRILWWQSWNSPDGERYIRRRMQGPYVPSVDGRDEPAGRAGNGEK